MAFLAAIAPVIGTITSVAGTVMSAMASSQAASYQAAIAARNAEVARLNANNSRQASFNNEQQQDFKTRALIGAQLAGQGASGLTIGAGSLGDITESTARLGRYDTLQTRYLGEKQAVDYENQAGAYEAQAELARMKAGNSMAEAFIGGLGSLASGASNIAAKWQGLQNAGVRIWNPTMEQ